RGLCRPLCRVRLSCYGDPCDLPSFPTRRSSDLCRRATACSATAGSNCAGTTGFTCMPSRANGDGALRHGNTSASWQQTANTASRSEEHTSELQSRFDLVCRLLLEKTTIEQELFR